MVAPGQKLMLRDVSWGEFEAILEELGDHRGSRLSYQHGIVEIRMPSPEHEVTKELIGDMVKILLEELDIDCEPFGSTTFSRRDLEQGIEPDQCFYIKNQSIVRGKKRIDLAIDPPPDLVIEIDLSSKTQLNIYRDLGVLEVWRFINRKLRIDTMQDTDYTESSTSLLFPGLPIIEVFSSLIGRYQALGRSSTLKAFRQWARENAHL